MTTTDIFKTTALIYAVMSVVTLLFYGWDKLCAKRGWRRVPELRLHFLSFACGWPGAWVAQQVFRHKSSKKSFRFVYVVTVLLNTFVAGGIIFALISGGGKK